MRSYTAGLGFREIWYFAPSAVLPELEGIREQLMRSGRAVEHLYTFDADAILAPPPLPTRIRSKKG